MFEFIGCMFPFIFIGIAVLIGWGIDSIYGSYCEYCVKKSYTKHPKLTELINERDKILAERACWWHQKNKAEKEIQDCEDKIRYGGSTPQLCEKLTKCHADWREAFENLERTEPLLIDTREAVENYIEEHNIRHW